MANALENDLRGAGFHERKPFDFSAQGLDLTFYPRGQDRLDALLGMIGGAQRSLKLFFYIFADDACAAQVRDALAEAAARGVAVTLMVDDFGSMAGDIFFAPLTREGAEVLRFSPRWNFRYLIRNHQKMVIADDTVAMIGGFNIEEAYFAPPKDDGWDDLAVRVKGDAVKQMVEWYARLERWTRDPKAHFLAIVKLVRDWDPGEGPVRLLIGGPSRRVSPWARCVVSDIAAATRLDMMMAYFSPRARMVRRIGDVAKRGRVRLVLPAKSDNEATVGAQRALYGRLLRRGASIYEFEPCKLHTKLVVVDDAVYFGSANFDMRSLYLNLEVMLRIEDSALAERMRQFVGEHLPYSTEITPALHRQRRTPWTRIRWTLSWFLVTVVDYTVTRRLNLGL